jgi:hypothetical protein
VQQKFSSPLPSGREIKVRALTTQRERASRFETHLLGDCCGVTPVKSSIEGSSGRSLALAARDLTPRRNPRAPSLIHLLPVQARDSPPEILESTLHVAGSGNELSRISTVRTPEPRFVLAQFLTFASAAEPPSFPRSLVRREQPQVDVSGHPPRSKSARSDSSRMGEQGTHLLLLGNRLNTHGMKNAKRWRVPDRISRAPALLPHLKRRDTSATEILEPSP